MHLLLIRHGQTGLHKRAIMTGWTNHPGLDFDGQRQVIEIKGERYGKAENHSRPGLTTHREDVS